MSFDSFHSVYKMEELAKGYFIVKKSLDYEMEEFEKTLQAIEENELHGKIFRSDISGNDAIVKAIMNYTERQMFKLKYDVVQFNKELKARLEKHINP